MKMKTKIGLVTMCSVCCALLCENVLAKESESQAARRSSISGSIKDFKETQQKSAEKGRERYELASQWFEAAEKGDIGTMKSLHEDHFSGNNINRKDDDGKTALEIAVQNGRADVVDWLLDCISADGVPFNINSLTAGHKALLTIATENGYEVIVRSLLEHSADVNAVDLSAEGRARTALMIAADKGYTEIVELLLNSKDDPKLHRRADLNEKDFDGRTALMLAVAKDHLDIAKLLLEHGAKIKTKDKKGKRALDYAEGNAKMTELLTEFLENDEKKGSKNVLKKVWNKVAKKSDGKKGSSGKNLSADSEATLYGDDAETGADLDDTTSLSTDTLVGE